MKQLYVLLITGCITSFKALPQSNHLLRLYEDNDFINVTGNGTDKWYTNGTRLDYFFQKDHPSRFFLDNWLPAAGPHSINTFSYSLMQVMLTPDDLTLAYPDKDDWPYSGALFLTHARYSSDPIRKLALRTEIVAGVMGPLSLAQEAQTLIHGIGGFQAPAGWRYQMPDDVLLNLNMQAEAMIWQPGDAFEWIGGGQVQAGTMLDGVSLHTQLRVGHMQPWFDGYMGRYSSKNADHSRIQYYLFVKPSVQWWSYNALLEGGVFSGKSNYYAGIGSKGQSPSINKMTTTVEEGVVLVLGNVSLSLTQMQMSSLLQGLSGQTIGNISVTYSW